ncbi:MAG TPA: AAA family ATPase, partial [Thermoleophilia bacterium]|nr:AAA family ATPase [Thermoleophilia bacterium]
MLAELSIENLVLIAEARLEFCPGLNVITSETGSGKTLLAQAIGLLAGQKGGEDLIRQGATRALVQALFESDEGSFVVARELPRGGRSRAHLNGLLSSAAAVEEALHQRLAFYGQLEHTRLLQLERQLELLDGAAPESITPLRRRYRDAYERACGLTRAYGEMRATHQEREREIDMLRFQMEEIDQAQLESGEEARLQLERERLRHAGKLLERIGGALALLAGEGEREGAALDGVRVAQRLVSEAVVLDESLTPLKARLDSLNAELDDLAAQLRGYLDDLDADPARRDAIELRHDKVRTLLRKYGDSTGEVLAFAETARQRLQAITSAAVDEERSATAVRAAQEEAVAAALALG